MDTNNNEGEGDLVHRDHHETTIMDLPENMIHLIASSLSLRDMACMSASLKQWRYICYNTPYWSIDIDKLRKYSSRGLLCLAMFINRLLIYRESNLQQLSLTISNNYHEKELGNSGFIDTLIARAIEFRVQELDLNIGFCDTNHYSFILPTNIFYLQFLRILKLNLNFRNLTINQSAELTNLQNLTLRHVVLVDDPFSASFLDRCPSLKTLCLDDCYGFTTLNVVSSSLETFSITQSIHKDNQLFLDHLNISCHKLKTFDLTSLDHLPISFKLLAPVLDSFDWTYGCFYEVCILNPFTSLKDATIRISTHKLNTDSTDDREVVFDLGWKLLDHVNHATNLSLCTQSVQILGWKIKEIPSFSLSNLECLTLFTDMLCAEESCSIMYILPRTPNLKTLKIIQCDEKMFFVLTLDDGTETQQMEFFHHLEIVEMSLLGDGEANFELLENLLKTGKALEQITIYYPSKRFDPNIAKRFHQKLRVIQKTSFCPFTNLSFLPH